MTCQASAFELMVDSGPFQGVDHCRPHPALRFGLRAFCLRRATKSPRLASEFLVRLRQSLSRQNKRRIALVCAAFVSVGAVVALALITSSPTKVPDSSTNPKSSTTQGPVTVAPLENIQISPSGLPKPLLNTYYLQTLTAVGGTSPYTWTLSSGVLPTGLSLSTAGVISGSIRVAGSWKFAVELTDSATPAVSIKKSYSMKVDFEVLPVTLPKAVITTPYSATLSASGGTAPYTWAIASGSLPAGLSLSASGVIAGTPLSAGISKVTLNVTDSSNPANIVVKSYAVRVNFEVSPAALPNPKVNVPYSATLSASGGTAPYTWAIASGSLPAGLSLSASGVIAGTPLSAGSSKVTLNVTDSSKPALSVVKPYTVTVSAAQ